MDARVWLRANGYDDVADLIDEIIAEWSASGNKTRRNWWEKLAGGSGGKPTKIGSRELPVLRAAQIRQGKPVTKNALCRNPREVPPPVEMQGRWKK